MPSKRGLNFQAILEAAIGIVDHEGLTSLTLASLAKKLMIKSPSLYNHINGMEGLKEALALKGMKILYEKLVEASIGRSGSEAIHQLSRAYLDFSRNHPGLYQCSLIAPAKGQKDLIEVSQSIVLLFQRILQYYDLEEENALHSVRGFRSLLHGFASLEQTKGFSTEIDLEISLAYNLDTFIEGLKRREVKTN